MPINSIGFSWLYVGLDTAAFAFGVACVFIGNTWRELGIALIVGALFGIGAFVGKLPICAIEFGATRVRSPIAR